MEIAMYRMEWQITSGSLAIRRTVTLAVRWTRRPLSMNFAGLAHRAVMILSRTVAP